MRRSDTRSKAHACTCFGVKSLPCWLYRLNSDEMESKALAPEERLGQHDAADISVITRPQRNVTTMGDSAAHFVNRPDPILERGQETVIEMWIEVPIQAHPARE